MTGLTFTWEGHVFPFSRMENGEESYKLIGCVFRGGGMRVEEDELAPGQQP